MTGNEPNGVAADLVDRSSDPVENVLDPMVFDDPEPKSVPFRIGDGEYVLREATADVARKFQNAATKGAKRGDDGKVTIGEGMHDAELVLLGGCVFRAYHDPKNPDVKKEAPVSAEVIKNWPHRISHKLFERAVRLSGMVPDGSEVKVPKAPSSDGTATSDSATS